MTVYMIWLMCWRLVVPDQPVHHLQYRGQYILRTLLLPNPQLLIKLCLGDEATLLVEAHMRSRTGKRRIWEGETTVLQSDICHSA
jgi:hypothetical protein